MARMRKSVAGTRARSRYNAGFGARVTGLQVGRRAHKSGTAVHFPGFKTPSFNSSKRKALVDTERGHGVMMFGARQIKPASAGYKARYGKIARANSRRVAKMYGKSSVGRHYAGDTNRELGYGLGGKRRTRQPRQATVGRGLFNKLHPRGPGGRFIRKR